MSHSLGIRATTLHTNNGFMITVAGLSPEISKIWTVLKNAIYKGKEILNKKEKQLNRYLMYVLVSLPFSKVFTDENSKWLKPATRKRKLDEAEDEDSSDEHWEDEEDEEEEEKVEQQKVKKGGKDQVKKVAKSKIKPVEQEVKDDEDDEAEDDDDAEDDDEDDDDEEMVDDYGTLDDVSGEAVEEESDGEEVCETTTETVFRYNP